MSAIPSPGAMRLDWRKFLTQLCSSDADADVLADYVLALLRHDGDVNAVRALCEEEIPDFLKEGRSTHGSLMRLLTAPQTARSS